MLFLGRSGSQQGALSDTGVMFLLSLPYLIIFIIGCHSMYLFNMVYDEREARNKEKAPAVRIR